MRLILTKVSGRRRPRAREGLVTLPRNRNVGVYPSSPAGLHHLRRRRAMHGMAAPAAAARHACMVDWQLVLFVRSCLCVLMSSSTQYSTTELAKLPVD